MLYKARNSVIKFFDYSLIIPEAKYKTNHGEGIKLLTPQRLPIAYAQVKAGNASDNLPNEIH